MLRLSRFFRSTLRPAAYHGAGRGAPFFEGWYFKLVDAPGSTTLAVIMGVYRGPAPTPSQAFIQVLDARSHRLTFYDFPVEQFKASADSFDVQIGENHFSAESLTLDLPEIQGRLTFHDIQPWPVSVISPGIMGWYAWMPFMECYHGVVSLDHTIQGRLNVQGVEIDFSHGRGYSEKDWGSRFPAAWVWVQSNHFATPGVSLTASTAMIPWLGRAFRGYIAGLWHEGLLHRFTTYNGSATERLSVTDLEVNWALRNRSHRLELIIQRAPGVHLYGPTPNGMAPLVEETIGASVSMRLSRLDGTILLDEIGRPAGLEIQGDIRSLLAMPA